MLVLFRLSSAGESISSHGVLVLMVAISSRCRSELIASGPFRTYYLETYFFIFVPNRIVFYPFIVMNCLCNLSISVGSPYGAWDDPDDFYNLVTDQLKMKLSDVSARREKSVRSMGLKSTSTSTTPC